MVMLLLLLLFLLTVALAWSAIVTRSDLELRLQVLESIELCIRRQLPIVPMLRKSAIGQPPRIRRALTRLARDLEQGEDLVEALEWSMPDSFPPSARAALSSAIGTAELPEILRSMRLHASDGLALRHKMSMAFLYPFALIATAILVGDHGGFFAGLPGAANGTGGAVATPMWVFYLGGKLGMPPGTSLILVVVTVLSACMLWRRSGMLRRLGRDLWARVPWRSRAARLLASGQFFMALSCLVRAGVALPQALSRAAGVFGAVHHQREIAAAIASLESGQPLDDALRLAGLPDFAVATVQAASRAEPTRLADAMERSAREARDRYVGARERWIDVLNPLLLGVVGLFVGSIALAAALVSPNVIGGFPW